MSGFGFETMRFEPLGGWIGLLLIILLAGGIAAWSYLSSPAPLARRRRIVLWGCRALALVVLFLILARPVLVYRQNASGRPELTVLVDESASMTMPSGDETRFDAARRIAREIEAGAAGRFDVVVRGVGDGVSPSGVTADVADSAQGSSLGEALERLMREPRRAPLAGVVLVSDGVTTRGRDLLSASRSLSVPLYTVAVGDSIPADDVQVIGVEAPPAAFAGERVPVTVRLRATSVEGTTNASVSLRDENGEVARRAVDISGGGAVVEARFELTPDRPGKRFYSASVSRGDADDVPINDRRSFALEVRKDRLQVLVLEERPSWDFSFLRRTLERDTTLAYSYVVRPGDRRTLTYGDVSTTGVPRTLAELRAFKAIVLGDVSRDFIGSAELDLIASFVEEGGGLLVLGGNRAPGLARFADQPIERVLPLRPAPPPTRGEGSLDSPPLGQQVTLLGDAHPLVALHGDLYGNRTVWRGLPPLRPAVASDAALPGAQVLVELAGERRTFPLITVGRAGSGRVVAFTGRSFWKWKFLREGLGDRDDFFDRYWVGVMRWLADPEPSVRVRIEPERLVFRHGDHVRLSGRALGEDLTPLEPEALRVHLHTGADSIPLTARWAERGDVSFDGGLLPAGEYRYTVSVEEAGAAPMTLGGEFRVDESGPEWLRLHARPDLLRQAAHETGGRSITSGEAATVASEIPAPVAVAGALHETLLWNHPIPVILLLLLLATEWWLRRRSGLA